MNTTAQNLMITSVANSSMFIKFIRNSGNIFLLFNTGIYIYQESTSLNYVASLPFPAALTSYANENYSLTV
jgi:hypothetical protein